MLNKIFCENCLTGMERIESNSIDFVLTDLPYNLTNCRGDKNAIDLEKFWTEVSRILKPKCSTALFASSKFVYKLYNSNPKQYKYKWIWEKNMPTMFVHAKNAPMRIFEEILIFSNGVVNHESLTKNRMKYFPQGVMKKEKPSLHQRKKSADTVINHGTIFKPYYVTEEGYPTDILKFNTPRNVGKNHPNEKPVELLEYLIKTYTSEGEVVLDATIGSGSTAVAAINSGRQFIGFELDEKYFKIACDRIKKANEERDKKC